MANSLQDLRSQGREQEADNTFRWTGRATRLQLDFQLGYSSSLTYYRSLMQTTGETMLLTSLRNALIKLKWNFIRAALLKVG